MYNGRVFRSTVLGVDMYLIRYVHLSKPIQQEKRIFIGSVVKDLTGITHVFALRRIPDVVAYCQLSDQFMARDGI